MDARKFRFGVWGLWGFVNRKAKRLFRFYRHPLLYASLVPQLWPELLEMACF